MLSHTISFSLSLNLHYLRIFNKDPNANRLYNHSIRACEKGKGLQRSFNPLALQIFSHYQDRRQMIRQDLGWVFTSYLTITMPHSSVFLIMLLGAILFFKNKNKDLCLKKKKKKEKKWKITNLFPKMLSPLKRVWCESSKSLWLTKGL